MRNHGGIHLLIAGMIAVGGPGQTARQSCRRLWFYGRRCRAVVVCQGNQTI